MKGYPLPGGPFDRVLARRRAASAAASTTPPLPAAQAQRPNTTQHLVIAKAVTWGNFTSALLRQIRSALTCGLLTLDANGAPLAEVLRADRRSGRVRGRAARRPSDAGPGVIRRSAAGGRAPGAGRRPFGAHRPSDACVRRGGSGPDRGDREPKRSRCRERAGVGRSRGPAGRTPMTTWRWSGRRRRSKAGARAARGDRDRLPCVREPRRDRAQPGRGRPGPARGARCSPAAAGPGAGDEEPRLRMQALRTLAASRGERAINVVAQALRDDSAPRVAHRRDPRPRAPRRRPGPARPEAGRPRPRPHDQPRRRTGSRRLVRASQLTPMVFAFAPIVALLLGLSAIVMPWETVLLAGRGAGHALGRPDRERHPGLVRARHRRPR